MNTKNKDPFARLSEEAFFFWITGLLGFVGLIGWLYGSSGRQIGTTYAHYLTNTTKDSSFSVPTFKVKRGEIYQIELKNTHISNSWMVVGVSILDDEDGVINEKEVEFWHESGYDSEDGAWSEGDYSEKFYFKASKTENISAEVYWLSSSKPKSHAQSYSMQVKVHKAGNALVSSYFKYICWIFGGLFLLGLGIMYGGD